MIKKLVFLSAFFAIQLATAAYRNPVRHYRVQGMSIAQIRERDKCYEQRLALQYPHLAGAIAQKSARKDELLRREAERRIIQAEQEIKRLQREREERIERYCEETERYAKRAREREAACDSEQEVVVKPDFEVVNEVLKDYLLPELADLVKGYFVEDASIPVITEPKKNSHKNKAGKGCCSIM